MTKPTPDQAAKLAAFHALLNRIPAAMRDVFDELQDRPATVFEVLGYPGSPVSVVLLGSTNPALLHTIERLMQASIRAMLGDPHAVTLKSIDPPSAPPSAPSVN